MSKDEIRNKLFKKGRALLPGYKKLENSKIQKNFLKTFELRKLKNILLYRNIKNVDLVSNYAFRLGLRVNFSALSKLGSSI